MFKKILLLVVSVILIFSSLVFAQSYEEKIVARINDTIILKSELDQFLMGRDTTEEEKLDILKDIINRKIVYLEASEKKEIQVAEEEIEKQVDGMINDMKKKFGGESGLQKALQEQGLSVNNLRSTYRNRIKENLYVNEYVGREIRPNINITEDELKEFYNKHEDKFQNPPKYTYEIAFLPVDVKEDDIEEIKTSLSSIRHKILNQEISFKEAAKEYSEGPTAQKGGDLGYIEKGQLVESFEEVIYNMDEGEISKPFKTKYGYHIAYLEDIKDNKRKAFHIVITPKPSEKKINDYYNNFKSQYDKNGWNGLKSWAEKLNIKFFNFNEVKPNEINSKIMEHLKNTKELSRPFYFNRGLVIVYLINKTEAKKRDFSEIKSRIKNMLMSRKIDEKINEVANQLKDKYYIEIFI
ncbi:MAG: hypothetical protein FXF47_03965 [Candidatus Mcinerneyibacterium aminivorans]|uniref:PpiC domain-containing protein n=1 Tax=Candidatus Mcinerneyibacterium aminivorans TaxID=2703815 RepID=A0A5D0MIY5_9BACT|nr:MAG: hypothetical protein FXF47_03965 [Candidatus Mcinerneyibacterium aminivorans]